LVDDPSVSTSVIAVAEAPPRGDVMADEPRYWFPAKRYGWGWGLPNAWQGWAVLAVFAALVLAGAIKLLPTYGSFIFVAYTALLSIGLVAVCWLKGERPSWRWGAK
jgi:hypothetical protein